MNGAERFNGTVRSSLVGNTSFLKGRLSYGKTFAGIAGKLKVQERLREEIGESADLTVPAILIISVTNRCNLDCRGCYACAQDRIPEEEMTTADVERICEEAVSAGVGIIFFAGGEPLLKEGLLSIPERFRDTLFVLFSNGTLFDEATLDRIGKMKNLVPAISLEGNSETTEKRRGRGVFAAVRKTMVEMDRRKYMFGASFTLTRENYDEVMEPRFLRSLENEGCRTLFLIEYVPCDGDPERCLTEQQKEDLQKQVSAFPGNYDMLPVWLPGDESKYGGCLAAGRGFLHVGSDGSLEACPFAPYADVNLKEMPFRKALESRLLKVIRNNHHLLEEAEGGCALFENREWVARLMEGAPV